MICFDQVIAVLLGEMAAAGTSSSSTRDRPVLCRRHRARVCAVIESLGKELAGGRQVPILRHQYVDDLAILVDRPVQVDPAPGNLHIRFVDNHRKPGTCRQGRAALINNGVNRCTQR
jgi:hypothetical protein